MRANILVTLDDETLCASRYRTTVNSAYIKRAKNRIPSPIFPMAKSLAFGVEVLFFCGGRGSLRPYPSMKSFTTLIALLLHHDGTRANTRPDIARFTNWLPTRVAGKRFPRDRSGNIPNLRPNGGITGHLQNHSGRRFGYQ